MKFEDNNIDEKEARRIAVEFLRRHILSEFVEATRGNNGSLPEEIIQARALHYYNVANFSGECVCFDQPGSAKVDNDIGHPDFWNVGIVVTSSDRPENFDGIDTIIDMKINKKTGKISDLRTEYPF